MKNLIARILAFFGGAMVQKIIKSIPAIVIAVEEDYRKAMADGKVTPIERKDLAVKTIDAIAAQFGVSITGIMRWVILQLIDNIAKKLPSKDINIPDILIRVKGEF